MKIKTKNCINALKLSIFLLPSFANSHMCHKSQHSFLGCMQQQQAASKIRIFLLSCCSVILCLVADNFAILFIGSRFAVIKLSFLFSMFELFFPTNLIIYVQDSRILVPQLTRPISLKKTCTTSTWFQSSKRLLRAYGNSMVPHWVSNFTQDTLVSQLPIGTPNTAPTNSNTSH